MNEGGIGTQAMAIRNLGVAFEHHRLCEIDKFAVTSYNAIHGTAFAPTDITQMRGADLGIDRTDEFCYLLTYSYPCTSLSKAGKMEGMTRGSGTASSLLWEVERLLDETPELPQLLLMENVPDAVAERNRDEFDEWCEFLRGKGYTSDYRVINATEHGVPQNRERIFMLSWLGDYYYDFPEPMPLTKRLRDVLETDVPEKYYLRTEVAERLCEELARREVANTIRTGGRGSYDRHMWDVVAEPQTEVVGSLNPDADYQQHAKTLGVDGVSQTVVSTSGGAKPPIIAEPTRVSEVANLYEAGERGYNRMNGVICSIAGVSQTVRANTGGHNEVKIAAPSGIYTNASPAFLRGPLPGLSRTLKSAKPDAGVIEPRIGAIRGRNPDNPTSRRAGVNNYNLCDYLYRVYLYANILDDIKSQKEQANEDCEDVREILRVLWESVGAENVRATARGLGCACASEVLRQGVHAESVFERGLQVADDSECARYCSANKQFNIKEIRMRKLRREWQARCASQGRKSEEQFSRELDSFVQKLSYEGSPPERSMYCVRRTYEGSWVLREALPEIQKIWESLSDTSKSDLRNLWKPCSCKGVVCETLSTETQRGNAFRIRKLLPICCWRLMGIADEDYEKASAVVSATQLYKQAGNALIPSIVEAILKPIFKED